VIFGLVVAAHVLLWLLLSQRRLTISVGHSADHALVFLAVPRAAPPSVQHDPAYRPSKPGPTPPLPPEQPNGGKLPDETLQAPNSPLSIDWRTEAGLAARRQAQSEDSPHRALDQHAAGADFNGGLGPDHQKPPEFGWDKTHTQRIVALEGGGTLLRISDRCVIVIVLPTLFPICGFGDIPARGDLFEHMRDAPKSDTNPNRAP
jgi:hypothetical protein